MKLQVQKCTPNSSINACGNCAPNPNINIREGSLGSISMDKGSLILMLVFGAQFPHAFMLEFGGHFCTCSFIDYQRQSCALMNNNNACGNWAPMSNINACGNCAPMSNINACGNCAPNTNINIREGSVGSISMDKGSLIFMLEFGAQVWHAILLSAVVQV